MFGTFHQWCCSVVFAVVVVASYDRFALAAPLVNERTDSVVVLPGQELSLQSILDRLLDADAPDVNIDQQNLATFRPTNATVFTYLEGIAGYRDSTQFGIYETDGLAERTIFDGSHVNGSIVVGEFSSSAQSRDFEWFLNVEVTGERMWSHDLENAGRAPQMLAFVGQGQPFLDPTIGIDGYFNPNDIIIAFEDLNRSIQGNSDDDFNDLIVLIENVGPGQTSPPPDFQIKLPEPRALVAWFLMLFVLLVYQRFRSSS